MRYRETQQRDQLIDELREMGACSDAITWAATQTDAQSAWSACSRGDWMLWVIGRLSGKLGSDSRSKLVGVAAAVAGLALSFYESTFDDQRVRDCIEKCKAYSRGECTLGELRKAGAAAAASANAAYAAYAAAAADADAADAAAYAAYAAADAAANAAYAADAAANAAYAADAAANAAAYAAYAAVDSAADAAANANANKADANKADANKADARAILLSRSADIVRRHYPNPPPSKRTKELEQ